jgi:hypothetical protein
MFLALASGESSKSPPIRAAPSIRIIQTSVADPVSVMLRPAASAQAPPWLYNPGNKMFELKTAAAKSIPPVNAQIELYADVRSAMTPRARGAGVLVMACTSPIQRAPEPSVTTPCTSPVKVAEAPRSTAPFASTSPVSLAKAPIDRAA